MKAEDLNVAVVGGGLVGSLCACFLGNRGIKVDLYELRDDIRLMEHVPGRSINLALSVRGRSALRAVGLEEEIIKKHAIPMYARMIHDLNGKRRPIPYGRKDQCIFSVGRRFVNEVLLSCAEKNPRVAIFFRHKLVSCNLESGTMTFERGEKEEVTASADLVIGCDGAFSAVRRQMMKRPHFNYSQTYISHGYMEFTMPATAGGQFAMEKNYLHIWPRDTFMLIALPNQDCSYTVTLMMPFEMFHTLHTPTKLADFLVSKFPDAVPLIGREKWIADFFKNQPSPLLSIKCSPYHIADKAIILGDAAHAMVPFYGQGMNAGFEDCLILDELLETFKYDLGRALPAFTSYRNQDAETICDLSMYNYIEMRNLVNSRKFLLRKKVDTILHRLFPRTWIPLYTTVTFSRTRYSECVKNREWQDKVLFRALCVGVVFSGAALVTVCRRVFQEHPDWTTSVIDLLQGYSNWRLRTF